METSERVCSFAKIVQNTSLVWNGCGIKLQILQCADGQEQAVTENIFKLSGPCVQYNICIALQIPWEAKSDKTHFWPKDNKLKYVALHWEFDVLQFQALNPSWEQKHGTPK